MCVCTYAHYAHLHYPPANEHRYGNPMVSQTKLSTSGLSFLSISMPIYWRIDFPSGLEWKLLEEGGYPLLLDKPIQYWVLALFIWAAFWLYSMLELDFETTSHGFV